MKLFIDDKRTAPEGWIVVRSVSSAKIAIDLYDYDIISCDGSLDYDLNGGGIEIMEYIIEQNKFPKSFNIHSTNIEISRKMERLGRKYFPCPVTSNKMD